MKKKIVIATDEEVTQFSGQSNPGAHPPEGSNPNPNSNSGGASDNAEGFETASASAGNSAGDTPVSALSDEQARSQAEEYKDKYLRAVAELSNFRKRAQKDREEALRYANTALVRSLIPVLDNLERVVSSAAEHPENTAAVVDGVKLTIGAFRKALSEHDVVSIEAEGQVFDPAVHQAMMQQPSDQHDTPTVLQVLEEGFKLFDRVIRPARVIVSMPTQGKQEESAAGEA